jgi:peptide/nickel transport system permease protein
MLYMTVLIVACAGAAVIAPYAPDAEDLDHVLAGPSSGHLLGTDDLGRDVLSRILYGGRVTLLDALEAVLTFAIVGIPLGLLAGFRGGRVDRAIMSVTDVVLAMPVIIILLVVAAVFTGDLPLMIALGVISAPSLVRVVRASTATVRSELYVRAAEVVGLSKRQIVRRHVLPQVLAPIMVQVTVFAAAAIAIEASLGFLGLDVSPPAPSWGSMVAEAATVIYQQSWLIIPCGGVIALTVIALGILGDELRGVQAESRSTAPAAKPPRPKRTTPSPVPRSVQADEPALDRSALLTVRELSVAVPAAAGEVPVVDGVSFALAQGECLGIVGESGCGKSMTAAAILGLLPTGARVAGGSVTFGGRELVGMRAKDRAGLRGSEIALISQEPMVALDPAFTVGSQLREVLRHHRQLGRRDASVASGALLEQVRLPNARLVAEKFPHELSGGMAQRVCIALALAGQPRLLIADEPTTALDVTVQAEILDLLLSLREANGMAILLITHDWGVVANSCERTAVMYAGQIVELATVSELFARPRHPYTEGLLAANPHLSGRGRLPSIPGTVPTPQDWSDSCRFAPRCRYATADCIASRVPSVTSEEGRETRCLHPERVGESWAGAHAGV